MGDPEKKSWIRDKLKEQKILLLQRMVAIKQDNPG